MKLLVLAVAMVTGGCLIPVNVDGDARVARDAGTACTTAGTVTVGGQAEQSTSFVFEACAPESVVVRASDGAPVASQVIVNGGAATVTFTPPAAGTYEIELLVSGAARTESVPVDDLRPRALTGGMTTRYVDRIDECFNAYFTSGGRLVCHLNGRTSLYDVDGSHLLSFTAANVSAAGSSLWTIYDGRIEHRTETDAGFRFDGDYVNAAISYGGSDRVSVEAHRASLATAAGLVAATWDGTAIDGGLEFPTVDFRASLGNYPRPALVEAGQLWDSSLCRIEPACVSRVCEPLRHCAYPGENLRVASLSAHSMWLTTGNLNTAKTLQLVERPFAMITATTPTRPLPTNFELNVPEFYVAPPFLFERDTQNRIAPIAEGGSFYFLNVVGLLTVTDEYIVSIVDPFTVRFTPR